MKSAQGSGHFKLDPRTKLLLMFLISITTFRAGNIYCMLAMAAIPILLLLMSGKPKAAMVSALLYAAAMLANELLAPMTHGVLNIFVVMIAGMFYRLMPVLIMGYYLVATTTVSEFTAAMERMHVSQKIVIPLCVMFRFFPTVREEAGSISNAMRMRGIRGINTLKNPMAMLEYRLVPMLMCSVKIGDELSAASLTRGLDNPEKRTNICKIGFSVIDILMMGTGIAAFAVSMLL